MQDNTSSKSFGDLQGGSFSQIKVTDKYKFLGCEIIYREACKLAAASPLRIDVEFQKKGLHDLKREEMQKRLQAAVDAVPESDGYKAILLGYARCNDGLVGLTARSIPLIIPKAHDCITFFFGGRAAYQTYFNTHPGTFYHTTGWLERNNPDIPGSQGVMQQLGLDATYEEMVEKYGKENADFILATLGDGLQNYTGICYLQMGATNEDPFIEASKQQAKERNWTFELRRGDWTILEKLFFGKWDDDFLLVPPGHRIVAQNDTEVLASAL